MMTKKIRMILKITRTVRLSEIYLHHSTELFVIYLYSEQEHAEKVEEFFPLL